MQVDVFSGSPGRDAAAALMQASGYVSEGGKAWKEAERESLRRTPVTASGYISDGRLSRDHKTENHIQDEQDENVRNDCR
jgi:hypothetical protein